MNIEGNDKQIMRIVLFSVFTLVLVLVALAGIMLPVAASTDLLLPNYVFSTNYYDSFGTPDIYFSVLGDPEFERGETVHLNINLANKGAIYGFKYDTSVGTDKGDHSLSLKELEYEMRCTTAVGIKAELLSDTPYIEVEPDTAIQTMESLVPGEMPEHPLTFTITISNKAPAGVYYMQLPISYQYQSQVRMTTHDAVRLGLTGIDHITHYTTANKTLAVPVYVKESGQFEVMNVSGHLTAGGTRTIDVTYKNTGEVTAWDAIARMVVMYPLSIEQSVVRLGTMEPGESKTARFRITSDPNTVIKTYSIDSEIKYLDEQDDVALSDNLGVPITIVEAERKVGAFILSVFGVIVLLIYLIVKVLRNPRKYD
ncbi:MAG: hypothetical protein M8349_02965 [ANME-2 cluster archaeon]|nr:hypothetical protein [ANME-2 cluster archaeon]